MKNWPLLAIALLIAAPVSSLGKSGNEISRRNRLQELRSGSKGIEPTILESAYLDVYDLLGTNNQCTQFYRGKGSQLVLEELVVRLRERTIPDATIGVRMFGAFQILGNHEAGITYRLFEKSDLNSMGAFYKSKTFPSQQLVPNIGSFRPNTREARIVILLHELAHMIKGPDGLWLIPDDGASDNTSRLNTQLIEAKCGNEIRGLFNH